MRKGKLLRYLIAMIMALGTTFNAMAQERALKIYFNEYANGETTPRMYVTDDHPNSEYDVPLGVTVTSENLAWAGKSRFFEWVQQDVTDRVMADYVKDNGQVNKKRSNLKINFNNFPYEVNMIQWNVMNDLLSGSVTNFFDNYQVTTKCVQSNNRAVTYSKKSWALNPFAHQTTFGQSDIPWEDGAVLKGLKSFEISEKFEIEVGFLGWTFFDLGEAALSDKVRTFIKAGWNGSKTNSNITDDDDDNWAFKVKFTLPDIRMRFRDGRSTNVIKTDETNVELYGTITGHAGAVSPTDNPQDPDDFHYEFTESSNGEIIKFEEVNYLGTIYKTGKIVAINHPGTVDVTVHLMRGNREVSSYTQTIYVRDYEITANAPQIAIAFADGNKGYDVTVGDNNAQIQGVITKAGKDNNGNTVSTTTSTNNVNGYHFEYTSGNTDIATINKTTGKITAKKEGDVNISAVLMNGTTPISEFYNYTLHVFAQHEGLEFRRINTYKYSVDGNTNYSGWKVTATNSQSYEWQSNNLLRVNTSINKAGDTYGVNDWKQIASFSTGEYGYWRAICQEVAFDVYVPKYTKSITQYSFAGNAAIGDKKTHSTSWVTSSNGNCKYGFEINYLNQKWVNGKPVNEQISLEQANTKLIDRMWDTDAGIVTQTFARSGASSYTSNVGAANALNREINNVDASNSNEHKHYTVYFAVMAYLWNNESYPGDVSIGFKGTPEYTYYTYITYHKNDGTGELLRATEEYTTTSKTESIQLFQNPTSTETAGLTRTGYTFLGWSTNPDATTPDYNLHEDFTLYDNVDGGGRGPVNLYAVWRANTYIVELRSSSNTTNYNVHGYVQATYGAAMPSVDIEGNTLAIPTVPQGYIFRGYERKENSTRTTYYDQNLNSAHVWDRTNDMDYIYVILVGKQSTVHLDHQGGTTTGINEFTATYGSNMPTSGLKAPTKTGYTFGGYYSAINGEGTQYYKTDMTGARTWNIDELEVTLYAKWNPRKFLVDLDDNGGTGGSTSVAAYYEQPMPLVDSNGKALKVPTRDGYIFLGYSINQEENNSQYYYQLDWQGNITSYSTWNTLGNGKLYAQWEKLYKITLDADGGKFDGSVDTYGTILEKNEGSLVLQARTNEAECSQVYCSNRINIKPGYKLLGWYTERQGEGDAEHPERPHKGTLVYSIEPGNNFSYHFYAVPNTPNAWNADGKWIGTSDLTLYAHYQIIFDVTDDVITFTDMTPKNCVSGEDLAEAFKYAREHGTTKEEINTIDMRYPDTGADQLQGEGIMEVFENAKAEANTIISPNALILFTSTYPTSRNTNAVTTTGDGSKCQNLVVTDRYPMRIPLAFEADQASYARDAGVVSTPENPDGAFEQAKVSYWGTLCLPYPIRNKANGVRYFWLESTANNYMEFQEFADDAVIPANTPVLYNRTDGAVGSQISIEEYYRNVPMNTTYEAVTIDYSDTFDPLEGYYPNEVAHASIHDWQFIGNLKMSIFCGKGYSKDYNGLPAGAQEVTEGNVFYFKQNTFTHLLPSRDIDGKHYKAGRMNLYPYRAYFYKKPKANDSGSKISTYSIVVVSEEGATDITNLVFGDGEGDGKIYDLTGVRVMQPVKGRIYIVNGQKKMYK